MGKKTVSILIVSPHLDDEVLGCASWFSEPDVAVLYTTKTHPQAGAQVYEENTKLCEKVELARYWTDFDNINQLDIRGQAALINEIEKIINVLCPSVILLPAPSYNQDHRACYDAGLTACRPHDHNWFVPVVLIYEEPETLGTMRRPDAFRPQYFRPLNVEYKLECYHIYASQVRDHRSDQHIRALAQVRGMQSNLDYAEAFEVARWVTVEDEA